MSSIEFKRDNKGQLVATSWTGPAKGQAHSDTPDPVRKLAIQSGLVNPEESFSKADRSAALDIINAERLAAGLAPLK